MQPLKINCLPKVNLNPIPGMQPFIGYHRQIRLSRGLRPEQAKETGVARASVRPDRYVGRRSGGLTTATHARAFSREHLLEFYTLSRSRLTGHRDTGQSVGHLPILCQAQTDKRPRYPLPRLGEPRLQISSIMTHVSTMPRESSLITGVPTLTIARGLALARSLARARTHARTRVRARLPHTEGIVDLGAINIEKRYKQSRRL